MQDLAYLNGGTGAGGRGGGGGSESVCTTHSHELTALALSVRGAMVATASTKVEVQYYGSYHWIMYILMIVGTKI